MQKELTMPLVKIKTKGQITIPKKIRDSLGLSEGDLIEVDVKNGKGIFMPRHVIAAAPAIKLSAKEQKALVRAKKKIQAITEDLINSKGLTREEVDVATKASLIDPDQQYWWTEEWQKGEREAERAIREGRSSGPFDNAEDLIDHLHKQRV